MPLRDVYNPGFSPKLESYAIEGKCRKRAHLGRRNSRFSEHIGFSSMSGFVLHRLCTRTIIFIVLCTSIVLQVDALKAQPVSATVQNASTSASDESWRWRRLLSAPTHQPYRNRRLLGTDRISDECTQSDISIFQGRSSPLPSGIPTYTVQIINLCVVGCPLSNIHVACGWFASAKLVNPKVFKRLGFNDCLVNDGKAIGGGESISFHYANSFQYPMRVESAEACSTV